MEKKFILMVSSVLLIGLLVGFALGYFVMPSLQNFQNQINDLQNQLTQKDSQIQTLQEQVDELESLLGPLRKGEWNLIQTFEDSNAYSWKRLVTDYFYIASTELRINWTFTQGDEELNSLLAFDLLREADNETIGTFALGENNGTTFIHNLEPANYFLDATAYNIEQWKITLEVWIPEQ